MEVPAYVRLTFVPVLMILVIPLFVYIPAIQRQQLLRIVNESISHALTETRHGA